MTLSDRLERVATFRKGDEIATLFLPDLHLPVDEVFKL